MKRIFTLLLGIVVFIAVHSQITPTVTINPDQRRTPLGTCDGNCPVDRNGNGTLGQIYNNSACGLNYVQTSMRLGQRFSPAGSPQPTAFSMTLPPCVSAANGSIDRAYIWCSTSGNGAAITVNVQNPQGVTQSFPMTLVGSGADKCWSYAGTYTYRADVTAIVTTGGNYTISGLPTGSPNDVDGATFMIIYRDPAATYRGSMVIHDGTVMIGGGTTTQTVTGINACAAGVNARAFCAVADIQMTGQTLTMNGTNAPFTWNWYNYVEVATNVTAGQANANYTISSGGDCYNFMMIGLYYQTTGCATCPAPNPLVVNPTSTPASCSACNGTATANPTGVSGPFTYSWAPSGGTGQTATNLCAGTYTVTVTASGGCITKTSTVTVGSSGGGITVNATTTPVLCNGGNTGSINTTVSGNTGATTYSWAPSGGTGSNATNLTAGTYTVTVTDAAGCTGTGSFTVTQPTALTATTTPTNISCNGGTNGSIVATPSGGSGGNTFSWSPSGGTGSTATNLGPGTYTVTITDVNGCTTTSSATVNQPTVLNATINPPTNVTCNGGNNGSLTVVASGGTLNYSYAWAPSGGTGATASNLAAGTYTVTVTDGAGCTRTATATITQPTALTATITAQTPTTCFGGNNGTATVTAGGGNGGYTYSWAPSGGTGATGTGLSSTIYTVTVTDAGGCIRTSTVAINQPPQVTATITNTTGVSCFGGNNGSATVAGGGGNLTYTYSWAPSGGTGTTASNLTAGTYTVTVTDGAGCTRTATTTITQPTQVVATITSTTPALCNGSANGAATVAGSGGAGNYTYSWAPSGGTGATASGLTAGIYTVTVTDQNNCSNTATANVSQPNALTVSVTSVVHPLCNNGTNGSITISTNGGAGGNVYQWSPSGGTGTTANGLGAGLYTVQVTDANNCTVTTSATLNNPPLLIAFVSAFDNVTCFGANDGWANTTVSGGTGAPTYLWSPGGGTNANPTNMAPGNYTVQVTDANNCQATANVTITQPAVVTATMSSITHVSCFGLSDGSLTVTPTGGDNNYQYSWSAGASTGTVNPNLVAGNYTVTVTDGNGCSASTSTAVNEPPQLAVSLTTTDAQLCNGDSTSLSVSATGGAGNLTYSWNPSLPANPNNIINPNSTTLYQITVTDTNGCSAADTLNITVSPLPVASFTFTNVCTGFTSGFNSTSTVSSGTITNYAWDFGDTSPISTNSNTTHVYGSAGTYQVVLAVATNMGCVDTSVQAVTVYPGPVVNFTADDPDGCETHCVNFTDLSSVSGSSITSWNWMSNGSGFSTTASPSHCFSNPGLYTIGLAVTTTEGCADTLYMNNYINVYALPVAAFTLTSYDISFKSPYAEVHDESINAASWQYNMGDGTIYNLANPVHLYGDTGTFCITQLVTSVNGCTDTAVACVNIYPDPTLFVPNAFTPNGDGINEIFSAVGVAIQTFEMRIFDRWGMEIFYSDDIAKGWSGIMNSGTPCMQDVYVYKIYAVDVNGDDYELMGQVNLIR